MLFTTGMGIGLVFWSIAEPITHFMSPPFGEAETVEAAGQYSTGPGGLPGGLLSDSLLPAFREAEPSVNLSTEHCWPRQLSALSGWLYSSAWGILLGGFAAVLLVAGGLGDLQTASITSAFPFMLDWQGIPCRLST